MQADGGACGGTRARRLDQERPGRLDQKPLTQERLALETGVPTASLGVEDPQLCPATRWPEPVPADDHLGPLSDDIPAEPDPRSTGQL